MTEINVAQPALSQGSATVMVMGHLLDYAPVSTTDQQSRLSAVALTEAASGARSILEQILELL